MNYCVDVDFEYKKSKSVMLRLSLLFSSLLTAIIVGDVLLVMLAGEEYTVNLIIAVALTVLFSWFAIFFFFNIYNDANSMYRFYRGYESGIKPVEEIEFLKKSDELCFINGLYVYPLYVRYSVGLSKIDKVIFSFNNDISFEMGDKLTITTYQRILINVEKHS